MMWRWAIKPTTSICSWYCLMVFGHIAWLNNASDASRCFMCVLTAPLRQRSITLWSSKRRRWTRDELPVRACSPRTSHGCVPTNLRHMQQNNNTTRQWIHPYYHILQNMRIFLSLVWLSSLTRHTSTPLTLCGFCWGCSLCDDFTRSKY